MRLRTKREPHTQPESQPEPWTVRYTALYDDGTKEIWERTYDWESKDRNAAAGNVLLSYKFGTYAQIHSGKRYPPHRLREVTWEVL